jgi:hypothetical protein
MEKTADHLDWMFGFIFCQVLVLPYNIGSVVRLGFQLHSDIYTMSWNNIIKQFCKMATLDESPFCLNRQYSGLKRLAERALLACIIGAWALPA